MTLLAIAIIIALLITIGLPVLAGVWANKKVGVSWHVITYGAMAYFIVQLLVTLVFSGFSLLVQNQTIMIAEGSLLSVQIILSIFLGALFGVIVRWAGMKFLKFDLVNHKSALGIGIGYGGVESLMLVGLPMLNTFITMMANRQIDPQTSTLDPAVISQIEALWQVPFTIPLIGALERIAAMVMHITVTIMILRSFQRNQPYWLAAALGLEIILNGLIAGLANAGVAYGWLVLISLGLLGLNLLILDLLGVIDFRHLLKKELPTSAEEPHQETDAEE